MSKLEYSRNIKSIKLCIERKMQIYVFLERKQKQSVIFSHYEPPGGIFVCSGSVIHRPKKDTCVTQQQTITPSSTYTIYIGCDHVSAVCAYLDI